MEQDGDLSSVDPTLLKLCQNAEQWKEQRRRALQQKVFANKELQQQGHSTMSSSHAAPMGTSDNAGDEAYVLAQLMNHKRKREAEVAPPPSTVVAPPPTTAVVPVAYPVSATPSSQPFAGTPSGLSLKEKLMQKYSSQ